MFFRCIHGRMIKVIIVVHVAVILRTDYNIHLGNHGTRWFRQYGCRYSDINTLVTLCDQKSELLEKSSRIFSFRSRKLLMLNHDETDLERNSVAKGYIEVCKTVVSCYCKAVRLTKSWYS